jgi:hypothetical protein
MSILFETYSQIQIYFKPLAEVIYLPVYEGSKMLGLPADEGILGICLLATFVMNLVLSHIFSPAIRKIYSTSLGLLVSNYVFGASFLLVLPYSMIGFACIHIFPRKKQHCVLIIIGGVLLTSFNLYA